VTRGVGGVGGVWLPQATTSVSPGRCRSIADSPIGTEGRRWGAPNQEPGAIVATEFQQDTPWTFGHALARVARAIGARP
jgi:hypothetical protein